MMSTREAVKLLTGMSDDELTDLGGFHDDPKVGCLKCARPVAVVNGAANCPCGWHWMSVERGGVAALAIYHDEQSDTYTTWTYRA